VKAVVFDRYGGPERLELVELPAPRPGPEQVLVRVRSAGVNPVDWKIRRGLLRPLLRPRLPLVPGWDLAGVVEAVGPRVRDLSLGDEVYGLLPIGQPGTYAELAVARADHLALKPSPLTFEEAAAMPLAALTALQGLRDVGKLRAGQEVLIHGGSGGVGTFAIQIAKVLGARVTATAGARNLELMKRLGTDRAVDYRRFDLRDDRAAYDLILDAVGKASFGDCVESLKSPGTYVTTLPGLGSLVVGGLTRILGTLGYGKQARHVLVHPDGEGLRWLAQRVSEGRLRPVIDSAFPLEEAQTAQERSEEGHATGKIVLRVA
jgi:NADPH:quinone reductase-like Zn-dependent oxidoreductase